MILNLTTAQNRANVIRTTAKNSGQDWNPEFRTTHTPRLKRFFCARVMAGCAGETSVSLFIVLSSSSNPNQPATLLLEQKVAVFQNQNGDTVMSNSTQITVDFHGNSIPVIEYNNEPYTSIKAIVEGMELDWGSQYRKLHSNKARWPTIVKMTMVGKDGKKRQTVCMPVRKLSGWLSSIQANKIKDPEIREKVIQHQNECDDVLWEHWSKKQGKYHHNDDASIYKPDISQLDKAERDLVVNFVSLSPEKQKQVTQYAEALKTGTALPHPVSTELNTDLSCVHYNNHIITFINRNGHVWIPVIQITDLIGIDYRTQVRNIKNNANYQTSIQQLHNNTQFLCLPSEQCIDWLLNINPHKLITKKQAMLVKVQHELPKILKVRTDVSQKLAEYKSPALPAPKAKTKPMTRSQLIKALEKIEGGKITIIKDSDVKKALKTYKEFDDQIIQLKIGSGRFLTELLGHTV